MSLDHPRRKPWKSSSNFVTSSVACTYLVHVYLYLPIMIAYDRVLHVKSDEKNDTGTPVGIDLPRSISPSTDQQVPFC